MTPDHMAALATQAINSAIKHSLPPGNAVVMLVFPKGFKRPQGFPRWELLCEKEDGSRTVAVKAMPLLEWVVDNLTWNAPTGVSK